MFNELPVAVSDTIACNRPEQCHDQQNDPDNLVVYHQHQVPP